MIKYFTGSLGAGSLKSEQSFLYALWKELFYKKKKSIITRHALQRAIHCKESGLMRIIRGFLITVNQRTLYVSMLSLAATWLSLLYEVTVDVPVGLIALVIVIPVVFAIYGALRRRDEALRCLASLKAHALSLYYAHRDWAYHHVEAHPRRAKGLLEFFFKSLREYFSSDEITEDRNFRKIHFAFSKFSESHEALRRSGVPAEEISLANRHLMAMMSDFEGMKNVLAYGTPVVVKAYSRVFLWVFPVISGPYFASLAGKTFPSLCYITAALCTIALVGLDNILDEVDNPCDELREEHIRINIWEGYEKVLFSKEKPVD